VDNASGNPSSVEFPLRIQPLALEYVVNNFVDILLTKVENTGNAVPYNALEEIRK
jgi:hypothetical protein